MQNLQIQSSHERGQHLLRVAGYIDLSNQHHFATALERACQDESIRDLALDLGSIDFIGSSGVSSILKTHGHLRSRRGSLRVVGCSPEAARIFTLLRVDFLLRQHALVSVEEPLGSATG